MPKKQKRPTPKKPWEPLWFSHMSEDGGQIWGNGKYTVTARDLPMKEPDEPPVTLLSIHTRTRSAVGAHDWRHFQRIKNQLCGEERWAMEFYPPESKLLDTANEYWMWVLPEGVEPGLGFHTPRDVAGPEDIPGEDLRPKGPLKSRARQRKLDADVS